MRKIHSHLKLFTPPYFRENTLGDSVAPLHETACVEGRGKDAIESARPGERGLPRIFGRCPRHLFHCLDCQIDIFARIERAEAEADSTNR